MGLDPIYLVLKSEAVGKSEKPWFRIAATEPNGLPPRFTGYNPDTNKYQDIQVVASGQHSEENWNVKMEYMNRIDEQVEIVGWAETLDMAGKHLTQCVMEAIKPFRDSGQKVRLAWDDKVDGNATASFHVKEDRTLEDASKRDTVYYWWEILRVSLEHDDLGPQWDEKERKAYMEQASQIALDTLKKNRGELTEQEEKDLEKRVENLGYVSIPLDRFKEVVGWEKTGDEEMQRLMEDIQRENEESSDDGGDEDKGEGVLFGDGMTEEQKQDPYIMGIE